MFERTVFLSKLIGCYCVLYSLVMFIHKTTLVAALDALVRSPSELLILGVLTLAAGLAMVLGHNVWSGGALPVVLTVVGWLVLAKGLVWVFLPPDAAAAYVSAFRLDALLPLYATVTLALGAYLTVGGFAAKRMRGRHAE